MLNVKINEDKLEQTDTKGGFCGVEISIERQGKMHKTNEIPVTYLCWGCGSSKTVYEESDILMPAQEKWNLCPDCISHAETTKKGDDGISVLSSEKAIKKHDAT